MCNLPDCLENFILYIYITYFLLNDAMIFYQSLYKDKSIDTNFIVNVFYLHGC